MDREKLRNKIKQMLLCDVPISADKPKTGLDVSDWYLKGKVDAYIELYDEEYMWDVPKSVRDVIQEEISLMK